MQVLLLNRSKYTCLSIHSLLEDIVIEDIEGVHGWVLRIETLEMGSFRGQYKQLEQMRTMLPQCLLIPL